MPVTTPSSSPTADMSTSTSTLGPSATTQNLIALSQDIAALLSLSIESGASLLHDVYRRTLSGVGLGKTHPHRSVASAGSSGEGGRGMAVVVIGAGEPTGQALSLHLARSGYTVFSLMPLPSPASPPTSAALSSLLLTWSRTQKRVRAKFPNHPGSVVPIITDPETDDTLTGSPPSDLKGKGRYAHAGDTVRAYCYEQNLTLVAIVCASRAPRKSRQIELPTPAPSPPRGKGRVKFIDQVSTPPTQSSPILPAFSSSSEVALPLVPFIRPLHPGSLALADDHTLISLYRANIIEPLALIRELRDLLSTSSSVGKGRSRVIFVNGAEGGGVDNLDEDVASAVTTRMEGAMRIVSTARAETARLLRSELGGVGIDVCEVLVGPMCPRSGAPGYHLRHSSDESNDSDKGRKKKIEDALKTEQRKEGQALDEDIEGKQVVVARRLALISRIWAVDDALLYSAVRRAIEDRYPRYRHHAGLSPLVASIAEITPGAEIVKMIGRWLVARLLTPRT